MTPLKELCFGQGFAAKHSQRLAIEVLLSRLLRERFRKLNKYDIRNLIQYKHHSTPIGQFTCLVDVPRFGQP